MKGHSLHSYHRYMPPLKNLGDIYICRVAPYDHTIHLEWQETGDAAYSVYCRPMGEGEFALCGTTSATEFDITDLPEGRDYEFYVTAGEKKSLVRLARTGPVEGVIVNYLHPQDPAYDFSGQYLGSPSLIRHPDGHLLASMDVFQGKNGMNFTLLYRSDDEGRTWHHVCELVPCTGASLFIHKGQLYLLGRSADYGDLLISKSTDGGNTFCTPTVILRGGNSQKLSVGFHTNPQKLHYHNGRLYAALEWGNWSNKVYGHAAMVMSCDQNDDLLVAENWSVTEPRPFDRFTPELELLPMDSITIEGNVVTSPEGKLYNIMRFGHYHKALVYQVDTEDHDAQLKYSHLMEFPANQSKFIIQYDEASGYYYTIGCYYTIDSLLYDPDAGTILSFDFQDMDKHDVRNCQSLLRSKDLTHWEVVKHLHDYRDQDPMKTGLQYSDFIMEDEDILYLTRTGLNEPSSFHNSNYCVFQRLKNFRAISE